jgi:hypothetical protein
VEATSSFEKGEETDEKAFDQCCSDSSYGDWAYDRRGGSTRRGINRVQKRAQDRYDDPCREQ